MNLYMIPIWFSYMGGTTAIIKANTLEEAREKAKELKREYETKMVSYTVINNEKEFGNIETFDHAFVSYFE